MSFENLIFFIAPAILVGVSVYMVLQKMLAAESMRRNAEIISASHKITIPMRLQAYERLTLFLERISPDSIVLRTQQSNTTNKDLHLALLLTIRSEFEHNLSQQLYVTNEAWEAVKAAKESMVTHVNESAMQVAPEGNSIELARKIVEGYVGVEKVDLIAKALLLLRTDVKKLF